MSRKEIEFFGSLVRYSAEQKYRERKEEIYSTLKDKVGADRLVMIQYYDSLSTWLNEEPVYRTKKKVKSILRKIFESILRKREKVHFFII